MIDRNQPSLADIEENMVIDYGFRKSDPGGHSEITVAPELARTEDETSPAPGQKPVGTVLQAQGWPVQFATKEVILFPQHDQQLDEFLRATGGRVLSTSEMVGDDLTAPAIPSYLIAVDPGSVPLENLGQLRQIFKEEEQLFASQPDVLALYAFVLYHKLEGYVLSANIRLQPRTAPGLSGSEVTDVGNSMKMIRATETPGDSICVPGDPTRPCVLNVPAIWSYLALTDRDERRIHVGVLDMGFAPNPDFRQPDSGELIECAINASLFGGSGGALCEPGVAQGSPTVGNSFFGEKSWHGTGVVTVLGGVVGNNFGSAGVGGQIVVPSLYKFDAGSYAFEMGLAMRLATDQGASCINISAGYPCTILTNIGPDFGICSKAGRALMCAEVVAAAAVTAGVVCGIGAFVPILGQIACAIVVDGVLVTTGACIAAHAFYGDLRGPMDSGVRYAANAGVPVVTIAGNKAHRDNLPPVLRDFVNIDNHRTESWKLMPAMAPDAIVVGAVGTDLGTTQYFGDRVDIWAPTPSSCFAPQDVNDPSSAAVNQSGGISATSTATPYISGVIAAMQAANPNPDRNSAALSEVCTPGIDRIGSGVGGLCRDITLRIKAILTDDANSFTNVDLVGFGRPDEPVERRRLVKGLAAVLAATKEPLPDMTAINERRALLFRPPVTPVPLLPDLAAMGYDHSLNFDEALPNNSFDTQSTARQVQPGDSVLGTVVKLNPSDGTGTQMPADLDWFSLAMTGTSGRIAKSSATLTYPEVLGRPTLFGQDVCLGNPTNSCRIGFRLGPIGQGPGEHSDIYSIVAPVGQLVRFAVTGDRRSDKVYRLELGGMEPVSPDVRILL